MGTVLHKIEITIFFLAMLLAIVLEAGIVYWISKYPVHASTPFSLAGEWNGVALAQGWLFGALLMLAYRFTAICFEPLNCAHSEAWRNRKAFLRLWCWIIAFIALEGFAFFLDRVAGA